MQKTNNNEALDWLRFKNGDREAFARLYRQHSHALIAYGLRLCPARDQLKDQIQELFLELWSSRDNLSPTDSVRFYLLKALRYKLIRLQKIRQSLNHPLPFSADITEGDNEDPVERIIMEKELQESQTALIKKAISGLTSRQQEIIQLRFYQGFSIKQISVLMEMNNQSVSNLLYRALCRMKDAIQIPVFLILLLHLFFI
jgi:RNA polymerase sigma factor (sigma-70 family)